MNFSNIENINKGFGNMADVYDAMREANIPVKKMREKFYSKVEQFVKPPADILEINCGTGIDAFYFAGKGYNVTATDISDRMLQNAQNKGKLSNLSFKKLNLLELNIVDKNYDLVISNLGGINCLNDLSGLSKNIHSILKPKGYFIVTTMPQFCVWEFLLLFKGEFKRAFRRLKPGGTIANVGGEKICVRYYSPKNLIKNFKLGFELKDTTALCVFSPPQPASHWYEKHPAITKILNSIDNKIESLYFTSFLGDYYIAVLQKR
jgi:ubiquinone/menaquinone biosynthesis C-methylase UbiE